MHQTIQLEATAYFFFAANNTSGSGADGATPVFDVREGGAAAGAAPTHSGTATLLTHADYPDGCHEIAIAATAANGFSAGKTYAVFAALLVDSQNPTGFVGAFTTTVGGSAGTFAAIYPDSLDITLGSPFHLIGIVYNGSNAPGNAESAPSAVVVKNDAVDGAVVIAVNSIATGWYDATGTVPTAGYASTDDLTLVVTTPLAGGRTHERTVRLNIVAAVTLDAQDIRDAVGLAAANLDDQIAALPTLAEVLDGITTDHGAGNYVDTGGGGGGGDATEANQELILSQLDSIEAQTDRITELTAIDTNLPTPKRGVLPIVRGDAYMGSRAIVLTFDSTNILPNDITGSTVFLKVQDPENPNTSLLINIEGTITQPVGQLKTYSFEVPNSETWNLDQDRYQADVEVLIDGDEDLPATAAVLEMIVTKDARDESQPS